MVLRLVLALLALLTLALGYFITTAIFWLMNQPQDGAVALAVILTAVLFIGIPSIYAYCWRRFLKPRWAAKSTPAPKEESCEKP